MRRHSEIPNAFGVIGMNQSLRPFLGASLAALGLVVVAGSTANASLVNGGFEDYGVAAGNVLFTPDTNFAGWRTTATDGIIEVWGSGFNGVPSYAGTDFVELNANQVSTLYQDVAAIAAGSTVGWQLAHRGRAGTDTMRLTITDLGTDGVFGTADDTVLFSQTFTDGNSAWGFYSGTGLVALGNAVRFAYQSISATGGDTVGNFLDAADFGVNVGVVPEPATLGIFALSLIGVAAVRRHRNG